MFFFYSAPNLVSDLVYLEKVINWLTITPIFSSILPHDSIFIDQLTNLVLSSQIASIATLIAEYRIEMHSHNQNKLLKKQDSKNLSVIDELSATSTSSSVPNRISDSIQLITISVINDKIPEKIICFVYNYFDYSFLN